MADARVDTIVRGGTVVTASSAFSASIAIRGEEIVAVGSDEDLPEADRQIDAAGKYVLPGPIDCHMHMGIENWREATTAAASPDRGKSLNSQVSNWNPKRWRY